jgi:hypothetical protein
MYTKSYILHFFSAGSGRPPRDLSSSMTVRNLPAKSAYTIDTLTVLATIKYFAGWPQLFPGKTRRIMAKERSIFLFGKNFFGQLDIPADLFRQFFRTGKFLFAP